MCDDLNCSIEGMGGHPQTKTPNMRRLMQRGVTFQNAHCNSPICGPSRSSMWSGLYPHTSGLYTFDHWNEYPLLRDTVMLQGHFKNNGYKVYGTGKLFHNKQEDMTLYHDFGAEPTFGPFPWDGLTEGRQTHPDLSVLFDSDKDIPIAWEQTFGPLSHTPRWPRGTETGPDAGWQLYGRPFRYVNSNDRDRMPDELSADWAIEKITQQEKEAPFFLGVGLNRPHTPLYVPDMYFDRFPLDEIKTPEHIENFFDRAPEITRFLYDYAQRRFNLIRNRDRDLWKEWIQAYLACISFVDDQVGRLLDALEASPHAEDTIIIFTSDNGYHMGEKNVLFKKTLWEEATRVPLIISAPGITPAGSECTRPVSLVDIYPTLNDLCGLPQDPNAGGTGQKLDGSSMRSLLEDPESGKWKGADHALIAVPTNRAVFEKYGPHAGPAHFSNRGQRWRYTLFGNGEEELFDHESDPRELDNLAAQGIQPDVKIEQRKHLLENTPDWLPEAEKPDWESQGWTTLA
jgi:arylsulfatase A-like enzyme